MSDKGDGDSLISGLTAGALIPVDPAYKGAYRLTLFLACVVLWAIISVAGYIFLPPEYFPWKALTAISAIALLLTLIIYPPRRYVFMGYRVEADAMLVARGRFFRTETLVPFARIQHLDVHRGPIERAFGLARLVMSTAGSHNGTVVLPGLASDTADELRAAIRASIQREQA